MEPDVELKRMKELLGDEIEAGDLSLVGFCHTGR